MVNDSITATGQLALVLRDAQGSIKEQRQHQNLVVTVGKAWIAARMKTAGTPTEMTHMAVGTGSVATAVGDTALGTEVARVVVGSSVTGSAVTYTATFPAGTGTAALTEAGIFNADTAGTLLCRTVFPAINKAAGDTLTVTWTVTIG